MINIVVLTPFMLSGLTAVIFREYQQRKRQKLLFANDNGATSAQKLLAQDKVNKKQRVIDDVVEIKHYQRASLATVALSTASWFYPPLYIAAIPLLTYDIFYLLKTISYSKHYQRRPLVSLLEIASVGSSFLSRQFVLCSLLLTASFGMRSLILKLGNFTQVDLPELFNPELAKVWVLRHGIEVETRLNEIQKGDVIVVREGELVMMSGIVIEGQGEVAQYTLAGSTQTRFKQYGDWVLTFSRVKSGRLCIQH
jgi:cation transport ATPase